jgi:hypothetical protein
LKVGLGQYLKETLPKPFIPTSQEFVLKAASEEVQIFFAMQ